MNSVLLSCLAFALSAAPLPTASQLKEREGLKKALLGVIERSPLKAARISVQMQSLDDGSVVFAQNADELLNPASNVKLVTAAAALGKLGTEYRFDTEFLVDSESKDSKDGKVKLLYVRGKGDPTLTTERLYGIVSDLMHAGLTEVGDLVLDDGWFDGNREPPGYDQENGDRAYLAPTGALSLNWNSVGIYLRPGGSPGTLPTVEVEPPSDYFTVESSLSTGSTTQRRFVVSSDFEASKNRQKLTVSGAVPVEKGAWSVWKKIDSPPLYFGFTLKALLAQRGVKVKGRLRLGTTPPGARMLHVAQSETLDIVLKKMNKHSSNFVAEQLIKTLGAEVKGLPGSTAKGIEAVEDFLEREVGLARGTYIVRNGSGLNDTNRFSAAQMNRLLKAMWERFPLAPEYLSSVGIAGKDGTLKYRFEGSEAVGRLRAKTGTLETVSALSGYVQAVGGERFVFSVLVNDFPGRASTVVQHIDALGAGLAALGSSGGPATAAASMTQTPSVVGPLDELKGRIKTYGVLAKQHDKRNVPFLRTAWRSEKDPAVRAVIAQALYQSDERDPASARILVDSLTPGDEAWGRLRRVAKELSIEVPGFGALLEVAASGNGDAIARLFELNRAVQGDEAAALVLADALATSANEAPAELVTTLKALPAAEREVGLDALSAGMVRAARPDAPLWTALKGAQGSLDEATAAFAREVEVALSLRIAEAKAPQLIPDGGPGPTPVVGGGNPGTTLPGGG